MSRTRASRPPARRARVAETRSQAVVQGLAVGTALARVAPVSRSRWPLRNLSGPVPDRTPPLEHRTCWLPSAFCAFRPPRCAARPQLAQFALAAVERSAGQARAAGPGHKPGTRKRGGQPGHGGSRRTRLPPEQVDEVARLFPPHCEGCADELPQAHDPEVHRYPQVQMPPIKPHTTEWRCHEVACPKCRHKTRAPYDPSIIPASRLPRDPMCSFTPMDREFSSRPSRHEEWTHKVGYRDLPAIP